MRLTLKILAAALALAALAAAPAQADPSPWWQVLSGSRPTHLQPPPDESEVQEVSTAKVDTGFFGEILVARIEVGGKPVGCLGTGEYFSQSANTICEDQTGFPATETPAALAELLEGEDIYDGEVQLAGPAGLGEGPFTVITSGRWVSQGLGLTPLVVLDPEGNDLTLGSASAAIVSEGSGRLTIVLTNLGDAPLDATSTPLEITDELPDGFVAYGAEGLAGGQGSAGPVECVVEAADLVRCSFEEELPSYEAIEVDVLVALTEPPGKPGTVTVSGGDGPSESVPQEVVVSDEPVPFGLEHFEMRAEEVGGGDAEDAGTHPFQLTNTVQFNSGRQIQIGEARAESIVEQPALPRNVRIALPAGLAGSAVAAPTCELAVFLAQSELKNECPAEAAVGVASVTVTAAILGFTRLAVPVFSLPPEHGEPARFGFMPAGVPVIVETSVDPDDDYRVIAEVRNAPQTAQVLSSTVSLWGEPGDPSHDPARGWGCLYFLSAPDECPEEFELSTEPLLRMPTSCAGPFSFEAELEPWNAPLGSVVDPASDTGGPLAGCNQVPFAPTVSAALTSKAAESPSGLDFELSLENPWPKDPSPGARAEAQAKRVEVVLPEGVTVNPSQAEGLATCSEEDLDEERFDSAPGEGCPEAAKIGSITGSSPLVSEPFEGALYIATPHENPFDTLIALYIVARIPERGILVKQAGRVEPDPRTGQLISTFDDLPQVPYDNFKLHFREGGRAPLVSPPRCGDFETIARFVPWSAEDPDNPQPYEVIERSDTFTIERGVDGGACPPGGIPPFAPGFEAGSLNNAAGAFSPFHMRLTRKDGEQDMTRFSATLPPGVLGSLAGVARCPEAAIAAAKAKSGKAELASPSCPAASEIGTTLAGAGVGSVLTYVPGRLYLGGPVGGAPLSVIAITPAVAGPFDVGTVVVREALTLNPKTAEVEVDGALSDPIPHILAGIPLKLRDLRVHVDRPDFTLNPTSCAEMATRATLSGSFADVFDPADDVPVGLAARYQAAGCRGLGFKPRLAFRLKGGTRRGAHPAFGAVYRPRPGDANLKGLIARLPRSAFLEQAHIRTICTRVQFAADACPRGARYGYIKAFTPLLDEPLQGPVYLRSSNHKLPDLVFDLHGIVDVEVSARIDSVRGGIRATLEDAPDAPLSVVVLRMQGAEKGLIVNSRDTCAGKNRVSVQLSGQNGRQSSARPALANERCAKQRKAKRAGHTRRGGQS